MYASRTTWVAVVKTFCKCKSRMLPISLLLSNKKNVITCLLIKDIFATGRQYPLPHEIILFQILLSLTSVYNLALGIGLFDRKNVEKTLSSVLGIVGLTGTMLLSVPWKNVFKEVCMIICQVCKKNAPQNNYLQKGCTSRSWQRRNRQWKIVHEYKRGQKVS